MDILERLQSLSNVLRLLHILRTIYSCNNECKTVNKKFKIWGALKQVSHHQFDCRGEVFVQLMLSPNLQSRAASHFLAVDTMIHLTKQTRKILVEVNC